MNAKDAEEKRREKKRKEENRMTGLSYPPPTPSKEGAAPPKGEPTPAVMLPRIVNKKGSSFQMDEEQYIVFRTAARLANFGMTEEERALTTTENLNRGARIA